MDDLYNLEHAHKLVRHLPITVERYDSGQICFAARPMINGRRFNRSFSTSTYPSLEAAAEAAKNYCREKSLSPESAGKFNRFDELAKIAVANGFDPVDAFRRGMAQLMSEKTLQQVSHVSQEQRNAMPGTVSNVVKAFLDSKRAENVSPPYLKELVAFYKPLELEFGNSGMEYITAPQIEKLLNKLTHEKRIQTEGYRKRWLSKFAYLWDFAVAPGRNWAPRNIITDLQK